MRIENLKASVLNVSEYRAVLASLQCGDEGRARRDR